MARSSASSGPSKRSFERFRIPPFPRGCGPDPKGFLGLSDEEAALIEMRLSLSRSLRERRVEGGLSQSDLATRMGSSQSRIAKMEAADSSVSLDLLIRSLLALGATTKDIARALGR